MRLPSHRLFGRRGLVPDPARTAIIGNVVVVDDGVILYNRPVNVSGVDDVFVHTHHRGVIGKGAAAPFAARETDPPVAEAVVHTAIVANVLAPIAVMKPIPAVVPAPVGGCP